MEEKEKKVLIEEINKLMERASAEKLICIYTMMMKLNISSGVYKHS